MAVGFLTICVAGGSFAWIKDRETELGATPRDFVGGARVECSDETSSPWIDIAGVCRSMICVAGRELGAANGRDLEATEVGGSRDLLGSLIDFRCIIRSLAFMPAPLVGDEGSTKPELL